MFFILDRRSFFDLAGQHAPWTALPITSAGRFSPFGLVGIARAETWTPTEINERQKTLAGLAVKAWAI
jgi:hypothetical protein